MRFNKHATQHFKKDINVQALNHPAWAAANEASKLLRQYTALLGSAMVHPSTKVATKSGDTVDQLFEKIGTQLRAVATEMNNNPPELVLKSVLMARLAVLHGVYATATLTGVVVLGATHTVLFLGEKAGKRIKDFKDDPATALREAKEACVNALEKVPGYINGLGQLVVKIGGQAVDLLKLVKAFFLEKVKPVLEAFGYSVVRNVEDWAPHLVEVQNVQNGLFGVDDQLHGSFDKR